MWRLSIQRGLRALFHGWHGRIRTNRRHPPGWCRQTTYNAPDRHGCKPSYGPCFEVTLVQRLVRVAKKSPCAQPLPNAFQLKVHQNGFQSRFRLDRLCPHTSGGTDAEAFLQTAQAIAFIVQLDDMFGEFRHGNLMAPNTGQVTFLRLHGKPLRQLVHPVVVRPTAPTRAKCRVAIQTLAK